MSSPLRCAAYTRKSTDEGLEQDFNSLQAQREACEAFIRSQRSEGWILIPDSYDDGGISGGTMERPALKRLMAHIEEKRIDVVVVYKVDRLTRSLSDFSRMVDLFDRHGVSFVAVTQQFNTTTSMGRLTLNVLLSFAQFEREVTAERIRDKIAASKKKGIWMGGPLPRGYRVEDRKLMVVPEQAALVRQIYDRYLACSGVRELAVTLQREGVAIRKEFGALDGSALGRGALHWLLKNPIYAGLIAHKGTTYPGQHEAIIERSVWDAVQKKLCEQKTYGDRPRHSRNDSPLKGKLFDDQARPLVPYARSKKGKRYRYYASHSDDRDEASLSSKPQSHWKLSAPDIERRVVDIAKDMIADETVIARAVLKAGLSTADLEALLKKMRAATHQDLLTWTERITLYPYRVAATLRLPESEIRLERAVNVVMKRCGIERRVVIAPETQPAGPPNPQILKALRVGQRFWANLSSDHPLSAVEFARQEGIDNRYVGRALSLAFLAPDIVERLVSGHHPCDWTAERLLRADSLDMDWGKQREGMGFTEIQVR